MKMRWTRRRKWLAGVLGTVGGLILLAWLIGPRLAAPYLQRRLQALVSEQLNAELQMGRLRYLPPYGLSVADAKLVTPGPDGQPLKLFEARRLDIRLAKLPLGGRLVIESIKLDNPAVHVIRMPDGLVGRKEQIVRPPPPQPEQREERKANLSQSFELRRIIVTGGQVIYQDRTVPDARPLAWTNLRADLKTEPKDRGLYGFEFSAGDDAVAELDAKGTFGLDDLRLGVAPLNVRVRVDPAAPTSPLPPEVQHWLNQFGGAGTFAATVNADLPLRSMSTASVSAGVELAVQGGRLPGAAAPFDAVDVRLACEVIPTPGGVGAGPTSAPAADTATSPASRPATFAAATSQPSTGPATQPGTPPARPTVKVQLERFDVRAGDARVQLAGAHVTVDPAARTWSLAGLTGAVDAGTSAVGVAALPGNVRDGFARAGARGRVEFALDASGPMAYGRADRDRFAAHLRVSPKDLRVQPAGFNAAIEEVPDFAVRVADGYATVSRLRARYGGDVFFVRDARLHLRDLPDVLLVDPLAGAVTFAPERPIYPRAVEKTLDDINPRGPFFFDGFARLDSTEPAGGGPAASGRTDFRLRVTTDRGGLAIKVGSRPEPFTNVWLEAEVTPAAVNVRSFSANALTGTVEGNVRVDLGKPVAYHTEFTMRAVDLNQFAQMFVPRGGKPVTMAGELSGEARLAWRGSKDVAKDTLTGAGRLEVNRGELWEIPVAKALADALAMDKRDLTVSRASGRFTLARREFRIPEARLDAPALGVRTAGWITMNGQCDLRAVASRVSGLDATAAGLLYRVDVTRSIDDPSVNVVPLGGIATGIEDLFRGIAEGLEGARPAPPPEGAPERDGHPAPPEPRAGSGRAR